MTLQTVITEQAARIETLTLALVEALALVDDPVGALNEWEYSSGESVKPAYDRMTALLGDAYNYLLPPHWFIVYSDYANRYYFVKAWDHVRYWGEYLDPFSDAATQFSEDDVVCWWAGRIDDDERARLSALVDTVNEEQEARKR